MRVPSRFFLQDTRSQSCVSSRDVWHVAWANLILADMLAEKISDAIVSAHGTGARR